MPVHGCSIASGNAELIADPDFTHHRRGCSAEEGPLVPKMSLSQLIAVLFLFPEYRSYGPVITTAIRQRRRFPALRSNLWIGERHKKDFNRSRDILCHIERAGVGSGDR